MATPVGRIEREYLFKVLFEEKIPVRYIKDRNEFILTLDCVAGVDELYFRPNKPITHLKLKDKLALLFNYRGQSVDFQTQIRLFKDDLIICSTPEMLYKNLDRNYLRIDTPSDLKVRFTFNGERYNLAFPKVSEFETVGVETNGGGNSKNLSGLISQMTKWLKDYADGYKIVNFKDKSPETTEEKIVSELGKALFIPSTMGHLPKVDPYPKKRIITEELFMRYLEGNGVGEKYLYDSCVRFVKNKFKDGIFSDAWIPILFHEYVIGYIHIWISEEGKLPFEFTVLDNMYQFSKVLAFALKENGYFEHGKMAKEAFEGRVLDISASGLLFAYPHGHSLSATLLIDAELMVSIETPKRIVNVMAKIVRRFKDRSANYLGCRFMDMEPEDMRYFFEYLYGRQVDDNDTAFLSGQV